MFIIIPKPMMKDETEWDGTLFNLIYSYLQLWWMNRRTLFI
jgi:hypothetical protein